MTLPTGYGAPDMIASSSPLKFKLQVLCGGEIALGPGKADLLAAIAATGSITAAGRQLGLSYRRTWLMVDTMNRCWREPLVATAHGGSRGGGAQLTALGTSVMAHYRAVQAGVEAALGDETLTVDVLPEPRPSQKA